MASRGSRSRGIGDIFFHQPTYIQNAHTSLQVSNLSCILLLSSFALVVARLGLVVVRSALIVARLAFAVAFLAAVVAHLALVVARLASVSQLAWLPCLPTWQTFYNTLSSQSLYGGTVHITVTHGVTYRCLEAF